MTDPEKPYLSYLLRLWRVQNRDQPVWRCSLENVQTGEQRGFSSLEALCVFLDGQTNPLSGDDQAEDVFVE